MGYTIVINFSSKTEGEKYAFSKEFILRYRVVKNLKPGLSDADILIFVANKFYGNDVAGLRESIRFIESKCGSITRLEDAPLDAQAASYVNGLNNEVTTKTNAHATKQGEKNAKTAELAAEQNNRNALSLALTAANQKVARRALRTPLLIAAAVIVGLVVISSFGGLVGTVNALTGWISNLAFTQLFTGIAAIYGGTQIFKKYKGKFSSPFKAGDDKAKAAAEKAQQDLDASTAKINTLTSEEAALAGEEAAALAEKNAAITKRNTENLKMAGYRADTPFMGDVDFCVTEINALYTAKKTDMVTRGMSSLEIQSLEKWRDHYVGALYFGVSKGTITVQADLDTIKAEADTKFIQVANPTYIGDKEYNSTTVAAGTNPKTNQMLDDMYASL